MAFSRILNQQRLKVNPRICSQTTGRGLVKKPEDSFMREFAGITREEQERRCGLRIDRVPQMG
jgi:hypothetical protein